MKIEVFGIIQANSSHLFIRKSYFQQQFQLRTTPVHAACDPIQQADEGKNVANNCVEQKRRIEGT